MTCPSVTERSPRHTLGPGATCGWRIANLPCNPPRYEVCPTTDPARSGDPRSGNPRITTAGSADACVPVSSRCGDRIAMFDNFWPTRGQMPVSGVSGKEMARCGGCDTAVIGLEGRRWNAPPGNGPESPKKWARIGYTMTVILCCPRTVRTHRFPLRNPRSWLSARDI